MTTHRTYAKTELEALHRRRDELEVSIDTVTTTSVEHPTKTYRWSLIEAIVQAENAIPDPAKVALAIVRELRAVATDLTAAIRKHGLDDAAWILARADAFDDMLGQLRGVVQGDEPASEARRHVARDEGDA